MKRLALFAAALLCLAGCGPKTDTPASAVGPGGEGFGRFKVSRVGVFDDGLAYGGQRGIYVVRDSVTGREFVGISGVGISEIGSHYVGAAGKGGHAQRDER